MMRWVGRFLVSCLPLAVVVCGNPGSAWAQSKLRVQLEYTADLALDCPNAAQLSAGVIEQLGYDPFTADPAAPRLRVAIAKLFDGAEAQIEWFDSRRRIESERRLASRGGGCAELAGSLPFAVAVQIQLHAAAEPPAPLPPLPPKPPEPAPTERRAQPQAPRTPPKPQLRIWVGAGALLRHGSTPGFSPGVRVFGTFAKPMWSLELSGHATWPGELQLADGSGFTASELGANLAPCVRFSPVGLCAVGTVGVLHVRGQGVDRVGSPSAIAGGVGGRVQLFLPVLERLGVNIQGEAVALLGPRDVLLNQTAVWSRSPVAFTAILDFAAIFK